MCPFHQFTLKAQRTNERQAQYSYLRCLTGMKIEINGQKKFYY